MRRLEPTLSFSRSLSSRSWSLGLLALQLGCGADAVITLGQGGPTPYFFDNGTAIAILNSPDNDDNPTLTEDMLEIYFTSDREGGMGGGDVWCATRGSRAERFGEPVPVAIANSEDDETSSAISADGNTLWVGSDRDDDGDDGGKDIWRTKRINRDSEWGALERVADLNSTEDDIPRPVALNGTIMPIASRRRAGNYETYLARRATPEADFSTDLEPVLPEPGQDTVDAFMTNDGLLLFFNRAEDEDDGDLYMSWRRSPDDSFDQVFALDAVNTEDDERDPWINSEGTRFFFSSDRGTGTRLDIYMAFIELPSTSALTRP